MNLSRYGKTITAVVTGVIGWAAAVVTSAPAHITASEWVMGATVLATALGVYAVPNVGQPAAPSVTTTTSGPVRPVNVAKKAAKKTAR